MSIPSAWRPCRASAEARAHVERYYEPFDRIRAEGLDALIITGANVTHPDLSNEPFWEPLIGRWSTGPWRMSPPPSAPVWPPMRCFSSATASAAMGCPRQEVGGLPAPGGGPPASPGGENVNTLFDVPHSRFNEIGRHQFDAAGLRVLAESDRGGGPPGGERGRLSPGLLPGPPGVRYRLPAQGIQAGGQAASSQASAARITPPFPSTTYPAAGPRHLGGAPRCAFSTALDRGQTPPKVPETRVATLPGQYLA
jgi:homoserine O-succinyltransferase